MKKSFLLFGLTLFVFSCAAVRVNYDYEKRTDFNAYKSYNFYTDMNTGMSELDAKRLLEVLEAGLQAKGMYISDSPDFLINIKSSTFQEGGRNNVGVGVGGGGGHVVAEFPLAFPLVNQRLAEK